MRIFEEIDDLKAFRSKTRKDGSSVGFVPTMGFLHEGHMSLVAESKKDCEATIVSIFVNPTQFGKNEDLDKYPRDLERDLSMLKAAEVDCVFSPKARDMYPEGFSTFVVPEGGLVSALEGEIRPGHFRGVATIVAKLFNLVQPDRAYFGQKDAQQCAVIRRMTEDLNIPVDIRICPTVREKDGLAMSSRNSYLNSKERKAAPVIYKALQMAQHMIELGEKDPSRVISEMRKKIGRSKLVDPDYVVITDPVTLLPVETITGRVHILVAARVGTTRLIDNLIIE